MKDGKDIFRVHQPGKHPKGSKNATFNFYEQQYNALTGETIRRTEKKSSRQFSDEQVKMLLKAEYGIDGYSLRTHGGRK